MTPRHPFFDSNPASGRFQTTHWSLVAAAAEQNSTQSAEALARFCAEYWTPLYAYVRRRGHPSHEAQDLTQEFFLRLLDKNFLESADRERGRFRSFLLATMKHFLANHRKAARAQKRGGGQSLLSLDFQAAEVAYQAEPADNRTPEQLFERQWALLLLERVLVRLENEFAEAGKSAHFDALRDCLTASHEHRPYSAIATQLEWTEAAVKMAASRLRKRYRELLRNEIGQTVAGPAEVEDELRQLFATLAE